MSFIAQQLHFLRGPPVGQPCYRRHVYVNITRVFSDRDDKKPTRFVTCAVYCLPRQRCARVVENAEPPPPAAAIGIDLKDEKNVWSKPEIPVEKSRSIPVSAAYVCLHICCDSDNPRTCTRRVFVSGRLAAPSSAGFRSPRCWRGRWRRFSSNKWSFVRRPPRTAKSVQVCPSPPPSTSLRAHCYRRARCWFQSRRTVTRRRGKQRTLVAARKMCSGAGADTRPSVVDSRLRYGGGPREKPLVVRKKKAICPTDRRNSAFPSLCSPSVGKPPLQPLLHIETARRRAPFPLAPRRIAFRCVFTAHSSTVPPPPAHPSFLIHVYFVFPFVFRSKFSAAAAANSNEQRRARRYGIQLPRITPAIGRPVVI